MEITADSVAADRTAIRTEGATLARLARSAWDSAVPTCPGWDVGTILLHTGGAHRWAEANLTTGERVRSSQMSAPPEGRDAQLAWYDDGLAALLAVASSVDPHRAAWTFAASGERRAAWWLRRMAQETSVHRWDADSAVASERAGAAPAPLDARLAVAGIDEYLVDFLPRLPAELFSGWTGTLHLHATDADGEWVLDLGDMTHPARREHTKADTALRGPASELLLWLWNRRTADDLAAFGDTSVLERWRLVTI